MPSASNTRARPGSRAPTSPGPPDRDRFARSRCRSVKLDSADGLAWSPGRRCCLLVELADEAGGVERNQQSAQLVELRRSELLLQLGLDLGDDVTDRLS